MSHSKQEEPLFEPNSVIWLLCHYPDTKETDERVEKAAHLHKQWSLPIWLYGSNSARYPESVEQMIKQKLISKGIGASAVLCSRDVSGAAPSLDTVQEACNVVTEAKRKGVQTLICVSNRLQLLQVRALLHREPLKFIWAYTRQRDWRWWYVLGRLVLIPLAFFGIGDRFVPLVFVRWARAKLPVWPF